MVMDFGDIKAILQPIIEQIDHHHLNDVMPKDSPPTAEYMASWIGSLIIASKLQEFVMLYSVAIVETSSCTALLLNPNCI